MAVRSPSDNEYREAIVRNFWSAVFGDPAEPGNRSIQLLTANGSRPELSMSINIDDRIEHRLIAHQALAELMDGEHWFEARTILLMLNHRPEVIPPLRDLLYELYELTQRVPHTHTQTQGSKIVRDISGT
jgi:hypothetical protein